MDDQELERLARELATACDECDAGRLPGDEFSQMLDRAYAGKSDRERMRIHLRIAQLQGRTSFVMQSNGEIESSNDEAEALALRLTDKLA